jgi:hypothetical protein
MNPRLERSCAMCIPNRRWLLPVAAATALALAGCGGGKDESASAPTPTETTSREMPTTTVDTDTASGARSGCDKIVAAFAKKAGAGGELDTVLLDGLGLAVPQRCHDLAELRAALAAHELNDLEEFVIRSCVAGDAWALRGKPSVTTDTALCREARSSFTLLSGRQLAPADETFADDFSAGCANWSTDRDHLVALSCRDGGYLVLVRRPVRPQASRVFAGQSQRQMSVEADAVLLFPRRGEMELHGVSCWTSPNLGYLFVLDPAGFFVIAREDHATGRLKVLRKGETTHSLTGVGVRNRIRGECAAGPGGVSLALYVNGDRVAVARDGAGPESFSGFGLYVITSEPGTLVRFDDVLVRGG